MKSPQRRTPAKKQRQNKVLTEEQVKALEETPTSSDDTIIDLSNFGAACETLSLDSITVSDTITLNSCHISTLDTSSITTITLPSVSYTGGSGSNCYTGTTYQPTWTTTSTGTGYTLGGISVSPPTVNINTDGIEIKEGGDLKVDGKSLKEFMTKMEQRLAILVPDPKKLEKFEALKKAYEHYKTMESLCFDEPVEEEKK
jgi:hypothetical protein